MPSVPVRSVLVLAVAVAVLAAVGVPPAAPAAPTPRAPSQSPCGAVEAGVQCGAGNDRRTPGGGEKVPHTGWPAVSGVLWKVLDSTGHDVAGGAANDELLGHHGSDAIAGGEGDDILWGDWDPADNTTHQRDVLRGGPGNDWIYPSHGATRVDAGPGRDHIWAFYGTGTIDCGAGDDTARVRLSGAFTVRNCEHVEHFCQFGSDGHGGCRRPGETLGVTRRTRGAR